MNRILYLVSCCNCAVEELGYTKIEILRRFSPIDVIYVADYTSDFGQDINNFIVKEKINLVVFEDDDYENYLPEIHPEVNTFTLGIKHGTLPERRYDLVLTHVLGHYTKYINVLYLPFSPGNMFKLKKTKRNKKVAIFSRLAKVKRDQVLAVLEKFQIDKIDAYVPRDDGDENIEVLDLVNIKECVPRDKIVDAYNEYDYVVIPRCECLCLPLREALMCGTVPILWSTKILSCGYTYFNDVMKFCVFPTFSQEHLEFVKNFIRTPDAQKQIHDLLSFDNMVLHFMMYLRVILDKPPIIRWRPQSIIDTEVISLRKEKSKYDPNELNYKSAVNWNEVLV